jgi:hypothetical protein
MGLLGNGAEARLLFDENNGSYGVTPTFNTKGYSDDLKTTKMDIIIIGLQPMPMEDVIEIQSGIFND